MGMQYTFGNFETTAVKRQFPGRVGMAQCGFMLKFENENLARQALSALAMQMPDLPELEVHGPLVCISTETQMDATCFAPQKMESGEGYFPAICKAVARQMSEAAFEGHCIYEESGMQMDITTRYTGNILSFSVNLKGETSDRYLVRFERLEGCELFFTGVQRRNKQR